MNTQINISISQDLIINGENYRVIEIDGNKLVLASHNVDSTNPVIEVIIVSLPFNK